MCLAIPMRLTEVEGTRGKVLEGCVEREVRLDLVEEARVGTYVLIHAGFAIQVLEETEAEETLALLREVYPDLFEEAAAAGGDRFDGEPAPGGDRDA